MLVLVLSLGVGCARGTVNTAAAPKTSPAPAPTVHTPKDGNYTGRGKVTKINMEPGSVEIDHEDIPDMMPAMKMEFNVRDKSILKGLAVGDKVEFVVEYKDYHETILNIKKI